MTDHATEGQQDERTKGATAGVEEEVMRALYRRFRRHDGPWTSLRLTWRVTRGLDADPPRTQP